MKDLRSAPAARGIRTAVIVMDSAIGAVLCPFFAKCDGVLILDAASGLREFHHNEHHTPSALCDVIQWANPHRLVCGYIGETEKRRLRSAGIDIRLGSCTRSIDELTECFRDLPKA